MLGDEGDTGGTNDSIISVTEQHRPLTTMTERNSTGTAGNEVGDAPTSDVKDKHEATAQEKVNYLHKTFNLRVG